jgi:hypothetical protein
MAEQKNVAMNAPAPHLDAGQHTQKGIHLMRDV